MAETAYGAVTAASSAGEHELMQFMPATSPTCGIDGDGDGMADTDNDADSIYSAANYLLPPAPLAASRAYGTHCSPITTPTAASTTSCCTRTPPTAMPGPACPRASRVCV